jgi:hypothetical protein
MINGLQSSHTKSCDFASSYAPPPTSHQPHTVVFVGGRNTKSYTLSSFCCGGADKWVALLVPLLQSHEYGETLWLFVGEASTMKSQSVYCVACIQDEAVGWNI